ncbi:MAG: hypothetical protein ACI9EF_001706 [Pseudohongiellaceae bacterium]|jgi:hypothetical protein
MKSLLKQVLKPFGSIGLSCVLVGLLSLLTWLGTLEQVNSGLFDVQKKYFESLFLVHWEGPIPIPLPGAYLVMVLLSINLIVGGLVNMRRKRENAGIMITHVGILFLMLAGFIKLFFSQDGHVSLSPDEEASSFQSYYRSEIVLFHGMDDGSVRQIFVPQETYLGGPGTTLSSAAVPFDLVVNEALRNADVRQKGPMFTVDAPIIDGAYLEHMEPENQAERNRPALHVTLVNKSDGSSQDGILSTLSRTPWVVEVDGQRWALDLRHELYPLPFTIQLDKFTKDDHPGMGMARSFSSDVTVTENGASRQLTISMNEPLRAQGLVVYQSGFGQDPNGNTYSDMEVVRNAADQYPLYACIIIAIGLVLHFSKRLTRYVRAEGKAS